MAQNHACKPTHNDENNAAFYYSVNMLRLLLGMKLISQEEYSHIVDATAAYYGTDLAKMLQTIMRGSAISILNP